MREPAITQAAGLQQIGVQHNARLVAMVNHGDEQAELPLLWRLCLTWVEYGYPVTVLDATMRETPDNPGLDQLLENPYMPCSVSNDAAAWSVFPAATGLQTLCTAHQPMQQMCAQMGSIFPADSVVIIYAKAEILTALLPNCALRPILVVSAAKQSLLTSYQALKRMLSSSKLRPLVVTGTVKGAGDHLAECARNFLGYEVKPVHLAMRQDEAPRSADLQGLALRVLESAQPLSSHWDFPTAAPATAEPNTWAGN